MGNRSKRFQSFVILLIGFCTAAAAQQKTYQLRGCITDISTGKPISFASLYLPDLSKGSITDINGQYTLQLDGNDDVKLKISGLGYATKELIVRAGLSKLDIALSPQSVTLAEFTVTAKYQNKVGSDASIGQEALEYIQPTSIQDIFQLLPGGKIGSDNMQNRKLISSRQVGADASTAFGMGININGIPVQNDGLRIQMSGFTGNSSTDKEGNISVNTGIDLRTISTDHIESVIIGRGIASAKEGNLSSGSIRINQKQGQSPLRARAKFDPLNKLLYIGKGLMLSKQLGTLYLGADIVRSTSNIEDTRGAYNRITTQANWNNQLTWFGKKIDMNVNGSYITSFNNNKTDDVIETYHEDYNTRYQRFMLSAKMTATTNWKLVDELELIASSDYSTDVLRHNRQVINQGITPLQMSTVEGESEGIYLPQSYRTFYRIENRPLNLFGQLTLTKYGNIGSNLHFTALAGTSVTSSKNRGLGAVVDPNRPPYPSSNFIRPRANSDIPAIANHAAYAEFKLRYKWKKHELNTQTGLRETMMLNLPSDYTLHGRILWEPRLQAAYTLSTGQLSNTWRIGYGVENKLPSADYLYPDRVYSDFIVLNAYFNEAAKRRLITYTKIQDPTNTRIRENKNRKIELGWDLRTSLFTFSLTAFHEQMNGGIEYFTTYSPVAYMYYYRLKYPVEGKPEKDDYDSYLCHNFVALRTPTNSSKVIKHGIEYRLHIPQLNLIQSEVEINGAYYKTIYTSGVPVMYHPTIMQNDRPYPYVGIYDGFEKTYAEDFNTNVWINTRLPKLKLIFTNFIQIVWFEKSRLGTDVDIYPQHFIDSDGRINELTPQMIASQNIFSSLRRDFHSSRYNELRTPISLRMNLKLTKEFSRRIKLSFFADNIIQASPKYKNNYHKTARDWHKPFFGAELTVNVF